MCSLILKGKIMMGRLSRPLFVRGKEMLSSLGTTTANIGDGLINNHKRGKGLVRHFLK